jgi:hypothetical protein
MAAWSHEEFGHTRSEKTRSAYSETITRDQNQFIGKLTALLEVSGMIGKLVAAESEE